MPKRARGRRKSKTRGGGGLSEASKQKLDAIAEEAKGETLEDLVADFDIQTETFIKQAKRTYIATAKKALQLLPPKSGFPKEILKMPASEFKLRGGSLAAVMESLKLEKQVGVVSGGPELSENNQGVPAAMDLEKENQQPVDPQQFVTPAMTTRSHAITGAAADTQKRMPKPLERVAMTTCSMSTGSPVDERTFLQLQLDQALEDMKSQLLESTTTFPQKWRSKLVKTLKTCKSNILTEDQELLTPALQR